MREFNGKYPIAYPIAVTCDGFDYQVIGGTTRAGYPALTFIAGKVHFAFLRFDNARNLYLDFLHPIGEKVPSYLAAKGYTGRYGIESGGLYVESRNDGPICVISRPDISGQTYFRDYFRPGLFERTAQEAGLAEVARSVVRAYRCL